jgi:hypothetical protein
VAVVRGLRLEAGTILVIDRGYNDYEWFAEMTGEGVFFVTRMKCNTVYTVEAECEVPAKGNVLRDQIISLPAQPPRPQLPSLSPGPPNHLAAADRHARRLAFRIARPARGRQPPKATARGSSASAPPK